MENLNVLVDYDIISRTLIHFQTFLNIKYVNKLVSQNFREL